MPSSLCAGVCFLIVCLVSLSSIVLLCLAAGAVSRMSLVLFTLFVSIDFWYRLFLLFIVWFLGFVFCAKILR